VYEYDDNMVLPLACQLAARARSRPADRAPVAIAACILAAGAAACGTSPAPLLDGAVSDTALPGDGPEVIPANRLTMPQITLAPGEETTRCVVVEMANETPQMLRRIRSVLSTGSHHLIAYRVASGTALQPVPQPCFPFGDITAGASPVIIAESVDAEVVYPDNVGLPFAAHQRIKLEEHFFNASDAAIQATGAVDFTLVDPTPDIVLADLLFWGPENFGIDRHSAGSADFAHVVDPGIHVFGLTTHEHHFGTLATIEVATSASGTGTEVYRNADWEHPPLKTFDPPLSFDGTQSLRLHCTWFNTSDDPVTFGLSAVTNEMCFFWAYYYPSRGFQSCTDRGC
jgi:hypothetical protein